MLYGRQLNDMCPLKGFTDFGVDQNEMKKEDGTVSQRKEQRLALDVNVDLKYDNKQTKGRLRKQI